VIRQVERQRKLEGKPPLVEFLTSRKDFKKIEKQNEALGPSRGPNGPLSSAAETKDEMQKDAQQ
jgi:hypothetical protein